VRTSDLLPVDARITSTAGSNTRYFRQKMKESQMLQLMADGTVGRARAGGIKFASV
jgi:hypothetical protein